MILVCIISPVVAPFILLIFYPIYHRLGVTTSYEYINQRFGQGAHRSVAGLFVLARRREPALTDPRGTGMDTAFVVML